MIEKEPSISTTPRVVFTLMVGAEYLLVLLIVLCPEDYAAGIACTIVGLGGLVTWYGKRHGVGPWPREGE